MTFGSLLAAGLATVASYTVAWFVLALISGMIFIAWGYAEIKVKKLIISTSK
ncbi:hypothetical protein N1495_00440 [Streptococcus didelphis]|uniref:DUF3272 family protein n=1 Tax=Streptococcus didelphis TaxID=102886 RepID=A0ABY9LGG9_9STRE|nr:hypothetical protein [Streptococcus didelphis]WMB27959.1 hypothetical protein N1496_08120 [Streptococcus didelphis]WMB29573.1 hypothetical protein N1495_00440 [Streptococcus didelphis]